jgi:cell division transport system ATP-binding protein
MIRFDAVSKRFANGHEALSQVSFSIQAGEMVFLTGHSGAGKSTALKLLLAQEKPTSGTVSLDNRDISALKDHQIPAIRRMIGPVFQDHRLLLDRTVFDNIALPLVIAGSRRQPLEQYVRIALNRVGLSHREKALPLQLSAGEQQRIGIARAIVTSPMLVIADEPTGNLDPQLANEIMELFSNLTQTGSTVLIASHDLHLISKLRKRVLVLENGKLIDDFRPTIKPNVKDHS